MSLPLEAVPRRYQRRADGVWVVPFLALGREERPFRDALAKAILRLEARRGRPRGEVGPEALDPLFPQGLGGYRAARVVWACLLEHYRFRGASLADALGPAAAAALAAQGMTTPWDLRRRLFTLLGRATGFTARQDRDRTLTALARDLALADVPPGALEAALWLDAPEAETLERPGELPEVAGLLARFRRRVLEALLFHSRELRLHLPTGAAWRAAYRTAKALRLAADPEPGGFLTLQGWAAAFADRGTGARLADAALYLVAVHGARGRAVVDLNGQAYLLALDDTVASALPPATATPPDFDSSVEARLYRGVQALGPSRRGWTLEREPPALVADDAVLIPDFLCRRGDLAVHLEVVGFWTEDYRRRKLAKLRVLAANLPDLRLALAVADGLPGFDDLPFPALVYRDTIDPEALLRFLEDRFDDLPGRLPAMGARLAALVAARGAGAWLVGPEDLARELGCYGVAEAERVLAQVGLPEGVHYLPGLGLCSPAFLETVRGLLAETVPVRGVAWDALAAALAGGVGFTGDVEALLRAAGGYEVRWRSLLEATVVPAGAPADQPQPEPGPTRRRRK
ncbi:MAG: DUF790 family protein [Chloroflexi bacterium]|nr:DUF790 family protein [Chloroflexota bacterium]